MRYEQSLRRRYRAVTGYTGLVLGIAGAVVLAPLLALPFFPEERAIAAGFLLPGLGLLTVGALLRRGLRPYGGESLNWQEGAVVVVLSWAGSIGACTAVFMFTNGLSPTLALFEATSGLTTTGLSVIDVTRASPLTLLFRSVLEYAGGAGLAIIMLSALAGPAGMGLSTAEGRGDPLVPHVKRSARIVVALYAAYTVAGIGMLRAAGMGWFDAVNHSMAAVSTGGFSTRAESIGYFDSPAIEAATIVLMMLGTVNFLTSWALMRGRVRVVLRNGEVRLQAMLLPAAALALFATVAGTFYTTLGKSLRVSVFETVSALSTTGFSTATYATWPALPVLLLILLMLVGGGTGSTAGGIKQYRVYVLLRSVAWEVGRRLRPRTAIVAHTVWVGEQRRPVDDRDVREIAVFVFLYLSTFVFGSGIIAAHGYELGTSLFEFASALGTVGLSLGVTSAEAPRGVLWVLTGGMFLGRLEFFAVFIGVVRLIRDGETMLRASAPAPRRRPPSVAP